MKTPYHIAIEGTIGVGKTSLTNILGERLEAKLIIEAANRYHIPVLHVSSQAVYGQPSKLPVDENYYCLGEIDEYATSKLIAENICLDLCISPLAIMRVSLGETQR